MPIKDQIKQFITTNFYVPEAAAIQDMTSFLDNGIIDSTGVLEVVTFIEQEFGITVEDSEMVPDNLDSIRNIASYVERKKR